MQLDDIKTMGVVFQLSGYLWRHQQIEKCKKKEKYERMKAANFQQLGC